MTTFLRALEFNDLQTGLELLCRHTRRRHPALASFSVAPERFRALPGTPFAYWISDDIAALFKPGNSFANIGLVAKQGLATADDFRFIRLAWEPTDRTRWKPFAKGGKDSRFYADLSTLVGWPSMRRELWANLGSSGSPRSNIWMLTGTEKEYFLQPGITWPMRSARFGPCALPGGSVFSPLGYSAFSPAESLSWIWAVLSSSTIDFLFKLSVGRAGHPVFLVGTLPTLPRPVVSEQERTLLASQVQSGWSLKRSLDTVVEVSHAFVVPAVLQVSGVGFGARVSAWGDWVAGVEAELVRVQSEIDDLCFELYGISDEDRRAITEGFGVTEDSVDDTDSSDEDSDEPDSEVELDPVGLAAGLVSWAVGVSVGRFDVRLATGEREWPAEPDPFDPLPVCSPGMLTGTDGLPATSVPAGYPIVPSPILVDDPGHALDITARVRTVFDVVFGDDADAWWSEVGAVLDSRNGVEGWLRRGFFDHHLKTYSKSRRKAPLMWPISTKSGSFQVWLYAHSVTDDTMFRLLEDVIEPKLAAEQRRLTDLTQEFGPSPSASQRRTLDTQQRLIDDITELRDETRAIAPLWHPDLNDGIVIVLAPLWRLFAHHRAWSKELKDRWIKLAKGDYDWAQLAMHIWPERVIPKCATDRSLAIAHNLEDTYWAQDTTNPDKWHPRHTPTTPTEQLITNRTNTTTHTTRNHPNP